MIFRSNSSILLIPYSLECIVLFYRQFRICITKAQGKAHTHKVARILRLSLWESSRRSRVRGGVIATICPLRRLHRHLSQRERLFANPIVTQIGRENNLSAEICLLRVAEDVDPYKCCAKHPYENAPKAAFFIIFLRNRLCGYLALLVTGDKPMCAVNSAKVDRHHGHDQVHIPILVRNDAVEQLQHGIGGGD